MKLSDFKGDKGIEVVGKLLLPISNISGNETVRKSWKKGIIPMISAALLNCPKDVREVFAILNDVPVEQYEVNAATVLNDALTLFEDDDLLRLFGLQS